MAISSTGFVIFDLFLVIGGAFVAVLVYFKHSYRYWKIKQVPYLEPTFPLGNDEYLLTKSTTFAGEAKTWYDQLKARGHKFGGVWSFSKKALVLVEPDYIRDVLTQDFHYFVNRDIFVNEEYDAQGTHLFNIRDPDWKPLRQKLTPTFTSGKMKMMFGSIVECCDHLIEHLEACAKTGQNIDSREALSSFTTDVIASVAFGVECNSFSKEESEFRKYGRLFFQPSRLDYSRLLLLRYFPDLARKLRLKLGNNQRTQFFCDMVKRTIDYRIQYKVNRPDFLQLLINMNMENNEKKFFSFDQIVANTILFFVAGFDTSSTAMNFSLFELARNPDVQEKTRQEIREVIQKHDGKLTYEGLQEMTYVKQVLDESMRMYPPLLTLSRICTKDYQLKNTNIILEKGTPVVISTLGLGRDPEYFPDPERFDPDRFSSVEKAKRHPYVHIPFGEGPRNCIGLRFGVMQSKIGIARILTNFKLSVSPDTKLPIMIDKRLFLLKETKPIYLQAEKI